MATHSLAIAKASLAAGMIRPDPTSLNRTEVSQLHALLENLLRICSPSNIQLCKDWLLKNISQSAARIIVFGKYLVALSISLGNLGDGKTPKSDKQDGPSTRRKQLHILYLLNDLLHHTKYHLESPSAHFTLTGNIQPYLTELFGIVSAYDPGIFRNHHRKVHDLLDIWAEKGYFDPPYIQILRDTVVNSPDTAHAGRKEVSSQSRSGLDEANGEHKADAPYTMPSTHGDVSTPFHDLPAGNMMPHIIPNSSTPIIPQLLKPLQLVAGPAEAALVIALEDFMKKVDPNVSTESDGETHTDIDELGNFIVRDAMTGELIGGEGYYGWSRGFCEKMKRRDGTENATRSMIRSYSPNRSLSPHKRRRFSNSESSRDWGRGRSRSTTGSRSGSAERRRYSQHRLRKSYPQSRSVSRSRRLPGYGEHNGSRARFRSRSRTSSRSRSRSVPRSNSYSPPPTRTEFRQNESPTILPPPFIPVRAPGSPAASPPPPSPFPKGFNQGFPLGPGGVPVPPPRPSNYQGPWPPPPPPPPARHSYLSSAGNSYATFPSFVPPPPPPPYNHVGQGELPMSHGAWGQQQQQQQSGESGDYSYLGPAPISPAFNNGSLQRQRARANRGGWE